MENNSPTPEERFSHWILLDEGFLPQRFPRTVVLVHPEAASTGRSSMPFLAPNVDHEGLSDEQMQAFDQAMLEVLDPALRCGFALYGGYSGPQEQRKLESIGMSAIEGRLRYFIGAGNLRDHLFIPSEDSFGAFLQLTHLWAQDWSWFVASPPDLDFTAVGCDDRIARRLLSDPVLDAVEVTDLRVAVRDATAGNALPQGDCDARSATQDPDAEDRFAEWKDDEQSISIRCRVPDVVARREGRGVAERRHRT